MNNASSILSALGLATGTAGALVARSPIDGMPLGRVEATTTDELDAVMTRAQTAFVALREVPAPRRGELVRRFGQLLRQHKAQLGALVSLESGKILQEGLGEVQEMIDICDFAVGLSRQLYGLTMASERAQHRMQESWHPLGVVGVISAFNFPVAVWAWNAALAWVCGDPVVWKPSEKTPLCALACQRMLEQAREGMNDVPDGVSQVVIGGQALGEALCDDPRVALLSATGSTAMGRAVAPRVAARFGRTLLELGGNNAMIVAPTAELKLTERAVLFSAVGTAGQRCTSLRRLIVHESLYDDLLARLLRAYAGVRVGHPLDPATLVGPLIDGASYARMQHALERARTEGGTTHGGERVQVHGSEGGFYVRPALIEMPVQSAVVREETFAPILYVLRYRDLDEAIALNNAVEQGLSSCIFTTDLREAERFLGPSGSDCGITNVNLGPSGAEIGGAFGGEKATGGGRESGSDAWKAYMRRATQTLNYSNALPLAQGIVFGDDG